MAVLVFTENSGGKFKKPAFEALSYGADLAESLGVPLLAVSVGQAGDDALQGLGKYGAQKVYNINADRLADFNEAAYADEIAALARQVGATAVVLSQTYNGRALAPRLSVKLEAALFSGVIELVQKAGTGYSVRRTAYTGKAIEELSTTRPAFVVTVKSNAYKLKENPKQVSIEAFAHTPDEKDFAAHMTEVHKASDKVSLTEADVVVSAGRGVGPSDNYEQYNKNWQVVGELADLLGAATASSKPVADLNLRPHHEHVGQTGIQIAPNVYIAIGISGAIQHLAGVSSSKTIIVINKDPEAPFFKAADYGIVGDAMDVVPRLVTAIKAYKAAQH